jgi:phage terminase large subunit-like protein
VAIKVLEGVIEQDDLFPYIFTMDADDDWEDSTLWRKSNPNLGVSVDLDDLREQARKAREIASALTSFLTKRLNIWTRASEQFIHPDKWKTCGGAFDVESLAGRTCYAGLDLSNTLDITAWVLVFPPTDDDPYWRVLPRFWVPETAMYERSRRDQVPYDAWVRQGWIEAIPGDVIDYEFLYAQFDRDAQMYDVKEVGFDRWGAAAIYLWFASRDMNVVQVGQGYASLSAPTKELEKLIVSGQIKHGDNPVLTWMAYNMVAQRDPAGGVKPDKKHSGEKIDGMVALIMGLSRATLHDPEGAASAYDDPAMVTIFQGGGHVRERDDAD